MGCIFWLNIVAIIKAVRQSLIGQKKKIAFKKQLVKDLLSQNLSNSPILTESPTHHLLCKTCQTDQQDDGCCSRPGLQNQSCIFWVSRTCVCVCVSLVGSFLNMTKLVGNGSVISCCHWPYSLDMVLTWPYSQHQCCEHVRSVHSTSSALLSAFFAKSLFFCGYLIQSF